MSVNDLNKRAQKRKMINLRGSVTKGRRYRMRAVTVQISRARPVCRQ